MTSPLPVWAYPGRKQGDSIDKTDSAFRDTLVCATYQQREALLRRMARLPDAAWDLACPVPQPPPGVVRLEEPHRTVRDIVAHLLLIDEMVLRGGALRAWSGIRRLEHPGAWDLRRIEPLAGLPVADLVTLLARHGERFGRLIGAAPSALRRVPVPGPFGRLPLSSLVARRVLHEWLHEHDVAQATQGPEPSMPAPISCVVADAVLQLLPAVGLPRMDVERGVVRVVVSCGSSDGVAVRRTWGIDFARRQYGPRVVQPADAVIRVDAASLALLTNGRGDRVAETACPQVEGSTGLGMQLLEAWSSSAVPVPCVGSPQAAVA